MRVFVSCTIGPVFETINLARKPLEIWMASYMYSRVAQSIVRHLNMNESIDIISPYETQTGKREEMFKGIKGAGTFSDHIIFSAKMSEKEARACLEEAKAAMYDEVAQEIANSIGCENRDSCKDYLQKKIYVLTVVKEAQSEDEFPISELVRDLEIQDRFPPFLRQEITSASEERSDYLLRFIDHDTLKKSSWVKDNDALQSSKADEVKTDNEADKEVALDDFGSIAHRSRHRKLLLNDYLAIIYSDGDSMGALNGKYAEMDLMPTGDKKPHDSYFRLSEFITGRAAFNIDYVRRYGAMPIYFGGDDMFFVAPIYGVDPEDPDGKRHIHVFQLVERLSEEFDKAWKNRKLPEVLKDGKPVIPSLSFGIAISHYKYPFRHMREDCLNALFGKAKHQEWTNDRSKKAVSIELRKHSGQMSSLILCGHKVDGKSAYSLVTDYIDVIIKNSIEGKDESALSRSMHWKVMEQYPLIKSMLQLNGKERANRLKAWFVANSSNEENTETQEFDCIISTMCAVFDSIGYSDDNAKRIENTIDGIFRLAEFMCAKN